MIQNQPYDTSLKALFREQTAEIVEFFLEGAIVQGELETDVFKPNPPLRADKALSILYRNEPHILHLELETGVNKRMPYRMLSYHALLLEAHNLPVISMIIYPFATKNIPESPLEERSGEEKLLTFNFKPVILGNLEAALYVRKHALPVYPLLPTMHGATVSLLMQAIDEMKERYKGQMLSRRLLWFRTLLGRVTTISSEDKLIVEEEINMFEELLEDDPYLKERDARVAAKAAAQAATQALQALQRTAVDVVRHRFPTLVGLAEQRVNAINNPEVLHELLVMLSTAPDEKTARFVLDPTAA
jgi:hypothetical protein